MKMQINHFQFTKNRIFVPIVLLTVGYIIVDIFFYFFLKYNFLQSDVLGYWTDSLNWRTPYHSFHVPGYPLFIALFRAVTFNIMPPILIMQIINISTFVISIYLIYKIIYSVGVDERIAMTSAFLFGLWPFVGLTYTVFPLADLPVICLFLLGFYYLQRSKLLPAGILFGFSLITHKAIWIFVFFVIVLDFYRRKEYFSKRNIVLLITTVLPLTILWLLGSFYHNSYTWLISSNLDVEMTSRSSFPILDGILGTLLGGGVKGIVKGMILIAFLAVDIVSLAENLKQISEFQHLGIAISLGVLALFIVLNQNEIWAAVRFSRLLIIPLVIGFSKSISTWFSRKEHVVMIASFLGVFFISQFAYAWYMARIFYA